METNESCTCCEKIVATFTSDAAFGNLLDLPNTYDSSSGHYAWVRHPMMTHAMVPHSIDGPKGIVDMYICCDEDDLDDIDLRELAGEFLRGAVLPRMGNITDVRLGEPTLTSPATGCWKLKHQTIGETV